MAAVAADADVAGRAVSRGAERALPRGLGQASSGHGGGCALLSRGLEESTRGHRGERRAGGPRGVSCQRARCLACEGLHRVHHHGRSVCCACCAVRFGLPLRSFGAVFALIWLAVAALKPGNNPRHRAPPAELCSSVKKRLRL